MRNIVYVKTTKSNNFFSEAIIIYSKVLYLILNVQVPIQNLYFKLFNMCKFAHNRKTQTKFEVYWQPPKNNLIWTSLKLSWPLPILKLIQLIPTLFFIE